MNEASPLDPPVAFAVRVRGAWKFALVLPSDSSPYASPRSTLAASFTPTRRFQCGPLRRRVRRPCTDSPPTRSLPGNRRSKRPRPPRCRICPALPRRICKLPCTTTTDSDGLYQISRDGQLPVHDDRQLARRSVGGPIEPPGRDAANPLSRGSDDDVSGNVQPQTRCACQAAEAAGSAAIAPRHDDDRERDPSEHAFVGVVRPVRFRTGDVPIQLALVGRSLRGTRRRPFMAAPPRPRTGLGDRPRTSATRATAPRSATSSRALLATMPPSNVAIDVTWPSGTNTVNSTVQVTLSYTHVSLVPFLPGISTLGMQAQSTMYVIH